MTDQNQAEQDTQQLSPGQMLTAAREALGLSQEAVAEQLYLSRNTIIDMENNDYSRSAAMVYSRGYVRSYARVVAADEDAVLSAFDAQNLVKKPTRPFEQPFMCIQKEQSLLLLLKRPSVIFTGLFGVLVIVFLLAWVTDLSMHHRQAPALLKPVIPVTKGHASLSLPDDKQQVDAAEKNAGLQQASSHHSAVVQQQSLTLKPTYTVTPKD